MYVLDGLALFFKRFFLLAAVLVLIMSVEFADRIEAGISEFYALVLFALCRHDVRRLGQMISHCSLSRWNSSRSRSTS